MMYLIDTNVVSEFRKESVGKADHHVTAWARSVPAESMFLSAICILEIETGTLLMERRDTAQGATLRAWMENHVLPAFAGRILPVDTPVAMRCATLQVPNPRSYRDALIAATALVHGMTVVTRNVSDFEPTGVAILNPWEN
ncbi:MAG: type II toxin-antitoxin system VapC family toxin [Terracidiphilus sp.]|nr:type II toxin-antitoxin system VapC family toxin [Terracidiphilus sp.]MDR3776273.1 type II toxin-antitoxin system VapC family toxin [Terracidiphilus sp.]